MASAGVFEAWSIATISSFVIIAGGGFRFRKGILGGEKGLQSAEQGEILLPSENMWYHFASDSTDDRRFHVGNHPFGEGDGGIFSNASRTQGEGMKKKLSMKELLLLGLIHLARFGAIFLFNALLAWLWYIYEEKPPKVTDAGRTLVIVFLFGNVALSDFLSFTRFFGKVERFIDPGVYRLFGRTRTVMTQREDSEVRLARVRHFKMQKRYDRALATVNEILEADPEFPEGIYLKATILWEGFGNSGAARRHLVRVLEMVADPEEGLHRWSKHLLEEMNRKPAPKRLEKKNDRRIVTLRNRNYHLQENGPSNPVKRRPARPSLHYPPTDLGP